MHNQEPTDNGRQDPQDPQDHGGSVTRRAVVAGSGILAVSAVLAGCSSYGGDAGQGAAPAAPGYPPADTPQGASPAAPGGEGLARTTDIPVGGGQVFPDQQVVVTQPEPANFRAFSATCTHQGCMVGEVANGTINCPCHGSKFSATDGSVVDGPAKKPLPTREVVAEGNWIRVV